MHRLVVVFGFLAALSNASFAADAPDTLMVTGPAFQQVPSASILVTPPGGPQTTLGDALANAGTAYTGASPIVVTGTVVGCPTCGTSAANVQSVGFASANGLCGTVANPTTTPVITPCTSITGLLKGNGTAVSAATAGTDYLAPAGSGAALTGITWTQIGSTPTTLAGYGITSPLPSAQGGTGVNNGSNTITTSLNFAITGSGAQTFFFGNSGVPWTYNFPQATATLAYQVGSLVSGHCLQASGTAGGVADAGAVCGSGGSGITTLTGDVAAGPGSGSQAATLATVNSNVGSFTSANITVNAKGLITAAANGSGGGGNVSNVGTPTSGQIAEWTTATTIQGVTATGTGTPVLATSPTLVTPNLGTPSAGVATNLTGTAASLTAGTATVANGLATSSSPVVVSAATAPTTGQVLTATSGTAATWQTPSSGGVTWPTSGDVVISNGTSTPAGAAFGTTVVNSSGVINTTAPDTVHTSSATTANIGGQDDYNAASLTATLATLSTGQTLAVTTTGNALTLALGGQTVIGLPLATTLHAYGSYGFTYNSAGSLTGYGFPGFGTITTNALGKFDDGTGAMTASSVTDNGTLIATAEPLVLNSATGGSQGAGTINASGLYVNGVAVSAGGGASLSANQAFTGINTFAGVLGGINVQSGTTYTTVASDCGKTLLMTGTSPVITIAASIAPASGTACVIGVIQGGSTKASVNGTAVSAASLVSASSYTGTSGTLGAVIDLVLTTVSSTATAYLTGNGS